MYKTFEILSKTDGDEKPSSPPPEQPIRLPNDDTNDGSKRTGVDMPAPRPVRPTKGDD